MTQAGTKNLAFDNRFHPDKRWRGRIGQVLRWRREAHVAESDRWAGDPVSDRGSRSLLGRARSRRLRVVVRPGLVVRDLFSGRCRTDLSFQSAARLLEATRAMFARNQFGLLTHASHHLRIDSFDARQVRARMILLTTAETEPNEAPAPLLTGLSEVDLGCTSAGWRIRRLTLWADQRSLWDRR